MAGLAIVTVISRAAARTTVPFNWDAVQYILGLQGFDIVLHQPHPPGNPLYIVLGRAVHLIVPDPNQALVTLSIVASVGAVVGIAALGARLTNRTLGLWAAILLTVNPLFWLYGEVALAYAPEAAFGIFVAIASWRAYQQPDRRSAMVLALSFAAAGGLRPTVLPLLGPLWLFGLVRMPWRTRWWAAGLTSAACLAWFVPLVVASGGLGTYIDETRWMGSRADIQTTIFRAPFEKWIENVQTLLVSLLIALNALLALAGVATIRRHPRLSSIEPRTLFLWTWFLPGFLVFALFHFGQLGYLLLVLSPAILLCLLAIQRAWPAWVTGLPALPMGCAVVGIALLLCAFFVPLGTNHDAAWREAQQVITNTPPSETMIISGVDQTGLFRIEGYLLAQYHALAVNTDFRGTPGVLYEALDGRSTYRLSPMMRSCEATRLDGVRTLILTGARLIAQVQDPEDWRRVELDDGSAILWSAQDGDPIYVYVSQDQIRIVHEADPDESSSLCHASPSEPLQGVGPAAN